MSGQSKVSDRDIHSILDKFGPTGEESFAKVERKEQNGQGDSVVWFVDPLKSQDSESCTTPLATEDKTLNALDDGVLVLRQVSERESDDDGDTSTNLHNEWFDMFHDETCIVKLRELAANCKLGSTSFRSICWRLFWECLPDEHSNWLDKTDQLRAEYELLRQKHLTDPYEAGTHEDLSVNNPLSQSEESPWHQYFQDNELKTTLHQDLDRLFPENHFFQKSEVKKGMLHILFIFAREHPMLNYRQGMHEILACIVHVFWVDYTRITECPTILNETISILHDLAFIEHDCYHLFRHVMDVIEPWYINVSADAEAIARSKTSAITKKLNRIQGYMLKRYDVQLFSYLKQLDIQPQLYGIRWLRLLFGREFQLHQLPLVWDVLFSQGITLDFADYLYVAMLIHIRGQILKADYATCLSYLMKYPSSDDLRLIIRKAFHLRKTKPASSKLLDKVTNTKGSPVLPREHPVKARLKAGISEEQKFASALGSSPVESNSRSGSRVKRGPVPWYTPDNKNRNGNLDREKQGYSGPQIDANDADTEADYEGRSEFVRDAAESPNKQGIGSHLTSVFSKHKVGSPGQIIAKLATKTKSRNRGVEVLSQLAEDHERLQQQVTLQQREIERICSLHMYCGEKMDAYLNILQRTMVGNESSNTETVSLCLAGLKQIKESLKKSSESPGSSADLDLDLCDIDKHLLIALGDGTPSHVSTESLESTHCEIPMPYEADFDHFTRDTSIFENSQLASKTLFSSTDSNEALSELTSTYQPPQAELSDKKSEAAKIPAESGDVDTESEQDIFRDPLLKETMSSSTDVEKNVENGECSIIGVNSQVGEEDGSTDSRRNETLESEENEIIDNCMDADSNDNGENIDCSSLSLESDVLRFDEELASISSRFIKDDS